jgi:hypothetical protein
MKQLTEIEKLFVQEVLDTHGEYVVDLLQDSISSLNLRLTDDLINSLDYKVETRGNDQVLVISFLSYGRAIEIQFHKSKRLRRELTSKSDKRNIRRAKKKDTRFYAKNVYGSLNRLLGRMASEYTDAEIARLKSILETRARTTP